MSGLLCGSFCILEKVGDRGLTKQEQAERDYMSGMKYKDIAEKYGTTINTVIDYGTVNPFSAGMWGFDGKRAIRERELYYNGREKGVRLDDETYYQKLKELIGDTPIEYIIIDPSAASFIEVIKKHGEYMVKGAKNDVLDGIRVTTTFLNTGRLFVHESCTNTIEEFGLYSWDEESGDDKVIKENDHAMDDTGNNNV